MSSLVFRERMAGWISFDERSYNQAMVHGRAGGNSCEQQLTISVDDVERFLAEPSHQARATGVVRCDQLGGELRVDDGRFNLFVADRASGQRRMLYRLFLRDSAGRPLTLSGFKNVEHGPNLDGWGNTSRLLIRILSGHLEEDPEGDELTIATGILHIGHPGFLAMLASFRSSRGAAGIRSLVEFDRFFVGELIRVFGRRSGVTNDADWPSPSPLDARWQGHAPGVWHDLNGHPGLRRRILEFVAGDGARGTLHHIRGERDPERGPVLLVHGCSVRANMFYGAPTQRTLVDALVDAGYDVWVENWRGSIDLPPSSWTLEQAAVHDHPAAVETILEQTGRSTLKAVVHCQGSTSFMMAAVSDLVPQVTTVVSNAVSLHIDLPRLSLLKASMITPALGLRLRGVDPQWTARPPAAINRATALFGTLGRRHRCESQVCRLSNYCYGVGPEVLWRHANLDPDTHEWTEREFGFCPTTFFKQIARCARRGHLVASEKLPGLPDSFVDGEPRTDARFVFLAGDRNRCFLPSSQQRTFAYFDALHPGRHSLHLLPGYTHLDVFFGREAHRNVYPLVVDALDAGR